MHARVLIFIHSLMYDTVQTNGDRILLRRIVCDFLFFKKGLYRGAHFRFEFQKKIPDNENKTCTPCEANCANCQDRPDYCISCEHHLVKHENKCFAACPEKTYETEDFRCADCHSSCQYCNGSSESQCILCRPNRFLLGGKCLNSCPDGYYGDKKRKECLMCPTGCAICNSEKCLTCKTDWVMNKKGKCVPGSNNCDECKIFE